MKTVVGLFDRYEAAERAVAELNRQGFARNDISVAARDRAIQDRVASGGTGDRMAEGAAGGAVGGAALGGIAGLLVGLGALAIPGIGPVIAAGTLGTALASAATGAGIGAVAGGLVGALVNMGIPEQDARVYAEGIKRGGVLVTVQAPDDRASLADRALHNAGALDVNQTRQDWTRSGWKDFDDKTMPADNYPAFSDRNRKM